MQDVVVVGASLAGATCAIELASLGHSVVLIDRAQFPRRKTCGEGLFPPGVEVLRKHGLLESLLPDARVVDSLRIRMNDQAVEAPLSRGLTLGIRREKLDNAVLELAVGSGVEVRLGVTANGLTEDDASYTGVRTSKGDIAARVVIAADGLRSRLRRLAGLDKPAKSQRFGVSARYSVPYEAAPRIDIFVCRSYELYVTPVHKNVVNLALLLDRSRSRQLGGNLRQAFDSIILEAGVLADGGELLDEPLAAGPFPASATRAWRSNLLLAGDAAGFFDGISGEGMSLALVSAQQCAQAVHAYLSDGREKHFAAYDRRRRHLARNSTLLARLSLFLAAHPSLGERVIGNLARRPATFAKLVAINQGGTGFRQLTLRDVLAFGLGV
jgi:flavin-dependent dehydrogenase